VPGCPITTQKDHIIRILLGKLLKETIHTYSIAMRHYQKERISGKRIDSSIGIAIFPNMVTGY
jgi:hypothetical protein